MWTKRIILATLSLAVALGTVIFDITLDPTSPYCRTAQASSVISGAEARSHWKLAMDYKQSRRYELARHHLLLALMNCKSTESRDVLQRELQLIDFQIRTLR